VEDATGAASMCGGRGRAHCSCSLDLLLLSTELLRTRTSPSGHPSPPIASTAAFTQLMGLHSTVPRDSVLWSARQEDSRDSCYRPQVGASTCFCAAMANQGCFSLPCYRVTSFQSAAVAFPAVGPHNSHHLALLFSIFYF
jgi:hypothetical protein